MAKTSGQHVARAAGIPAGATVRGYLAVDLQVVEDVLQNRLQDFAELITRVGRWLQQTLPRAQP